ncbi:MAG: cytochrome c [Nitrospinota bacterium]|nr:cytochrome c [Nitrospinota bacterium]
MKNLILIALVLILNFLITSCSVKPRKTVPEEYKAGQEYYHRECAGCHGPDAMGGNRAPNLIQKIYSSAAYSNGKISKVILNGSSSGAMPSLKGNLSDKEIKEIIKYIRYSQKDSGLE